MKGSTRNKCAKLKENSIVSATARSYCFLFVDKSLAIILKLCIHFFGQLSLAQYLQWFLRMSLAVKQPNRSGPHRTFIKSCKVTASDLQRVTAFEIHCRHFLT